MSDNVVFELYRDFESDGAQAFIEYPSMCDLTLILALNSASQRELRQ
jgi:hypothetical protein